MAKIVGIIENTFLYKTDKELLKQLNNLENRGWQLIDLKTTYAATGRKAVCQFLERESATTGERQSNIQNVIPRFSDEDSEEFEEEEEADFKICMSCGNIQFAGMSCKKCCGPTMDGYT